MAPPVLITGASTGIGRACARLLATWGYAVLAGVRNDADAQAISDEAPKYVNRGGSLAPVRIDVTDADSIAAAMRSAAEAFDGRLFALINNAGVVVAGPVEHVSLADWRRQFDINFFGQIAVTQAMLPMLKKYQASAPPRAARVVYVSSIAGRVSQPIVGPYCASKFALEAMADALRIELRASGMGVTLIEPGAIDTPIWKKGKAFADALPSDHPAMAEYGELVRGVTIGAAQAAERAVPALRVAHVLLDVLSHKRAPIRRLVGTDAKLGAIAKWLAPDDLMDAVLDRSVRRIARKSTKA